MILAQRARLAFWSPLVCAIILAGIFYSPFGFTEVQMEVEIQDDDDNVQTEKITMKMDFHSGYVEYLGSNTMSDHPFESESQIMQWESIDGDIEDLEDISEKVGDSSTQIMYLTFLLVLLLIVRLQGEWFGNKFFNGKSVTGVLLAMIFLVSISSAFTIYSELEDGLEWFEENWEDELANEWDDGFFGGGEMSSDEGDLKVSYGPSSAFWLFLILSMIALTGSAANLSYLKEDLEIEDKPTWFTSEQPPYFITKNMPKFGNLLLTIAVIAVFTSLIMPWYSVDQTWEVNRVDFDPDSGEETWDNSTHEIGWEMTPYVLRYTNDSSLETGNGSESTSFDSYSEHNELTNISPIILQLRWPLTCASILGLFYLSWNNNKRLSEKMDGKKNLWSLFMMVGLIAILSFGTGSFHKDMEKYAEDDLIGLTPDRNMSISNLAAQDSFYGKSMSVSGGFWGGDTYYVLHEWGGGIGYFAAGLSQWLIIAGLLVNSGPRIINKLNEEENPFTFDFNQEEWKTRPAIAALVSILLLSTLGSGMGELVVDSEKAAPPGEYEWYVNYSDIQNWGDEDKNFESDEEWILEINLGNETTHVTWIEFGFWCDEASGGLGTDQDDTIDWDISPPSGVAMGEMAVQGTLNCNDNGNQNVETDFYGDYYLPETLVYAETEDAVRAMISWPNTGEGTWTITISANVNGGTTPLSNDNDLDVIFYYTTESIDENSIEIINLDDD